jgi:hypothetical protein
MLCLLALLLLLLVCTLPNHLLQATSYAGINLANSMASHPLLNCLFYYSLILVHPTKSMKYIEQNRNKKNGVKNLSHLYANITRGEAFNNLMNSGIVHPTGVLFIPCLVATSTAGRQE